METASPHPANPQNSLEALVHDLTEASAWADTAIERWLAQILPWPPDSELASLLTKQAALLVEAKQRWEALPDPHRVRRLAPPQRGDLVNCIEYFALAGLRLRLASTSGEARHPQDASESIQVGGSISGR